MWPNFYFCKSKWCKKCTKNNEFVQNNFKAKCFLWKVQCHSITPHETWILKIYLNFGHSDWQKCKNADRLDFKSIQPSKFRKFKFSATKMKLILSLKGSTLIWLNSCKLSLKFSQSHRASWYCQRFFYLPTDAQESCFKKSIKIYIKTAPTCFGLMTIIRERIIRACWSYCC